MSWSVTYTKDSGYFMIFEMLSEIDAYVMAAANIIDDLNLCINLGNPSHFNQAKIISDSVDAGVTLSKSDIPRAIAEFAYAIDHWNCFSKIEVKSSPQYNVVYRPVIPVPSQPKSIAHLFNKQPDVITSIQIPINFGNGATCRICKTSNEYAVPDRQDGTYHCSGCKIQSNAFGGS